MIKQLRLTSACRQNTRERFLFIDIGRLKIGRRRRRNIAVIMPGMHLCSLLIEQYLKERRYKTPSTLRFLLSLVITSLHSFIKMSIADYISEGGYVAGISEYLDDAHNSMFDDFGVGSHRRQVNDATKKNREKLWKQLCNDQRWKHKDDSTKEDLKCGQNTDEVCYTGVWTTIPVPIGGSYDGAQAPTWVWESTPIKLEQETEESYLQRLICVVCGRFVCLIGVNGNDDNDRGIPQAGERYSWRYWDNEGRVYQDTRFKWTTYPGDEMYTGNMETNCRPGEFDANPLWMFDHDVCCREFYDVVWRWKHEIAIVEELDILAKQAGICIKASTVLKENDLDNLARGKGWTKITSLQQPDMASYRQDSKRINFYLTTGTVGTCLDHPIQYKTQLFRRGVDMKDAAILLDNPREHTGRGYKRKATSDIVHTRKCGMCFADKYNIDFSKNQRRMGSNAKCKDCVQKSMK